MKFITLTLNPAFDIHCNIGKFLPERENHIRSVERYIGGKGINISRALISSGVPSKAYVVLGRKNAADFEEELLRTGIDYSAIYIDGRIRENLTIHPDAGEETRINFEGYGIKKQTVSAVFEKILPECDSDTIFIFAGRLPYGLCADDFAPFLSGIKERGAKLVIDSNSFSLADYISARPWLIKPNEEEISACFGKHIETLDEATEAAKKIHAQGIENVMVSLGGKGAVLASDNVCCTVTVPRVKVLSTIGAGDSTIAGFCIAFAEGKEEHLCLVNAASYGTAACITAGTQPPELSEVERIRKMVKLNIIS
ncbi:MAG: 1-phosphofructokinase family hexose kinase [Eubacteriales bacterium]